MDLMDDVMHVLSGDEEVPDFLNRKLNPSTPATVEERKEWAKGFAPTQDVSDRHGGLALLALDTTPEDAAALDAMEQEKKAATARRIAKMLAKKKEKDQTKGIPDDFLGWDWRTSKFYDVRLRAARKHAAKRAEMGLPVQTEAEARASVVRCLGLKSWEKRK
jgi:hypothetical protein